MYIIKRPAIVKAGLHYIKKSKHTELEIQCCIQALQDDIRTMVTLLSRTFISTDPGPMVLADSSNDLTCKK